MGTHAIVMQAPRLDDDLCLPVNDDNRLVGMVSIRDVLNLRLDELPARDRSAAESGESDGS